MRSLKGQDHNISRETGYSTPVDQDIDLWMDWALIGAYEERGRKWHSSVLVSVCTKYVHLRVPRILSPWQ